MLPLLKSYKNLVNWSLSNFQDLPWRKNRSLYTTLVSEIMLQQTTVPTVLNHYSQFLERFPNFSSLAKASPEEIQIAWKGLGYYRRARNLHVASQDVVSFFSGKLPLEYQTLVGIKGIGDYTAHALRSIGGNLNSLALDANLERVLARIYGISLPKGPKLKKEIMKKFENGEILKKEMKTLGPRAVNEALMDLGRVFCRAKKVDCENCFFLGQCYAEKLNKALMIPLPDKEKAKSREELVLLRVITYKKNKIIGYQKSEKEWLSGQVEIPTYVLSSTDKNFQQYPFFPAEKISLENCPSFQTSITKYKIKNIVLRCQEDFFLKNFPKEDRFAFYDSRFKNSNFSTSTIKSLATKNRDEDRPDSV